MRPGRNRIKPGQLFAFKWLLNKRAFSPDDQLHLTPQPVNTFSEVRYIPSLTRFDVARFGLSQPEA
jgi:hypothetical protein